MKSIATRLISTFLLVIVALSVIFTLVGVQVIGSRIVAEAQERVRTDLNSAREIYLGRLSHVYEVVRFTAEALWLRDALVSGDWKRAAPALANRREKERLDILTITDADGVVVLRTSNPTTTGDRQSENELVREALNKKIPVAATSIVPVEQLRKESPQLAERAYFKFIPTPKARPRKETEETAGMVLLASAPIFDYQNNLIGIAYGGTLINRNWDIVDKIKQTVFQDVKYEGQDIGTATIFQDDFRISTNVRNADGSRAIGTRVAEDVYSRVIGEGMPWVGRAFVVNNWYITAYEPIRNIHQKIIGILYVGILEQKYIDIRNRSIALFLGVALAGAVLAMMLSYFISRQISRPIQQLVLASRELAGGNLDATVEVASNGELRELADAFNAMAAALRARDVKLKEFARKRIMESERLAIIGQLAANVAHELNNPLQGIVTYSHLLLEKLPPDGTSKDFLNKIVTQADRCTYIIRGLLDFSRQRVPQKRSANMNSIVRECLSLVESQALFHNIEIVRDLRGDVPQIVVDPSEMQQVLINLLINAAEAMDSGGRLTLATRYDPAENMVEVEVADTGHGISKEDLERIFDPFFTTKEVGHGTGLGLAISYGIISEHKGTISVESEVGKGTTFLIRLPVVTEEVTVNSGTTV